MHPLGTNLTTLSDDELHQKFGDLTKRFNQAYRMGPHSVLPQLQMIMADYQNEINNRNTRKMEELMERAAQGKGFTGIIDIK